MLPTSVRPFPSSRGHCVLSDRWSVYKYHRVSVFVYRTRYDRYMVRNPLTPEQIAAGRRLGARLRELRGDRPLGDVASGAGISPETLRKIETGRMPTPAFATIAALARALGTSLDDLALVLDAEVARVG